jgi:hypothetical protein
MTVGSMIVLAIVIAAIGGAVISVVRNHRSGHCSCGCDGCCKNCKRCIEIKE